MLKKLHVPGYQFIITTYTITPVLEFLTKGTSGSDGGLKRFLIELLV